MVPQRKLLIHRMRTVRLDATCTNSKAAPPGIEDAHDPGMADKSDRLRDRVESRKHELLAKYDQLKADSRREAAEARARLQARLDELELHLKSGWNKVSAEVRTKLGRWLEHRD
jgi:hypothetical protein